MRLHISATSILAAALTLASVACTNIVPLDVDDEAQQELINKREKPKKEAEKKLLGENKADSARISESNKLNRQKYLEDLRAYKESDHMITFGWFANWNPESPDPVFNLDLLPDSVDFVSNWGPSFNLSQAHKEQLKRAHERGIGMTIGWIVGDVGQGINAPEGGWMQWRDQSGEVDWRKSIEAYAQALADSIQKYDYDGFDLDYEPAYISPDGKRQSCGTWSSDDVVAIISCNQSGNKERENYFFRQLREKFDEKEKAMGKKLMLNVNGALHWLDPDAVQYFDYFIAQSYNNTGSRWVSSVDRFASKGITRKQLLITETFQTNEPNANSFINNYARVAIENGLGGVGAFHINEDHIYGPNYGNIRGAISLMNPPMIPEKNLK